MRTGWLTAVLVIVTTPAMASPCSGEIDALQRRVEDQGHKAIASSSSGQGDAAARGGQGMAGAAGEASQRPPEKSAAAGQGADKAQAAKVALDEARTADGKGDTKGCDEAVARAKKSLDAAP